MSLLADLRANLQPWRVESSVYAIDFGRLQSQGVRGVVFDLENTLVTYRAEAIPDSALALLKRLEDAGLALGIVSNSKRAWVVAVADRLGIPYLGNAGKPRGSAFFRVVAQMPVPGGTCVVIGDQLLTDVFGAQRLGLKAILVPPLGSAEPLTSKIQRLIVPRVARALGCKLS